MKRILGLDLGTSSIGWAVVDQATTDQEKSSIIDLGVRVNPLTTDEKSYFEKGKSITTTANRTLKRGMRRNLSRYKLRRADLLATLKREHFIPSDFCYSEQGNASTFQTYRLRAKAVTEPITLEEFAKVLLMLNKKRGYKSNRKADSSEEGQLVDGMEIAKKLYEEGLTPGQFVYESINNNNRYIPTFYRSDLQAEFDLIWGKQQSYYPEILTSSLYDSIHRQGKRSTAQIIFKTCNITTAENKDKDRMVRLRTAYRWRSEAVIQKIDIRQLAYVLAEINGQITESSGYLGAISDHSKELYFNKLTIGQYLIRELDKDPHFRVRNRVFYRQDYLQEFNTIWDFQAQHHPELTNALKNEIRDTIIFYQRRLRSQKGLVAICELEGREISVPNKEHKVMTGPKVCPKSSPLFQEFKIWQSLNNLQLERKDAITSLNKKSLETGDNERFAQLTQDQKQLLFEELQYQPRLNDKSILKLLGLKSAEWECNFKEVQGNLTNCAFLEAYKNIIDWSGHDVEQFDKYDSTRKKEIISSVFAVLDAKKEFLNMEIGENEIESNIYYRLWHLIYSYEGDNSATGNNSLIDKIHHLTGLGKEYSRAIASIGFTDDYASISTKAIKKIMPFLRQGDNYSDACAKAGYRHSKQSLTKEELENRPLVKSIELLPKNSLRNPVVEKIINQMIHVVNKLSQTYGKPDKNGECHFDEIHIEMARNLKQTQKQRESDTRNINLRTKATESIIERIKNGEFGISIVNPSRNDILRVRLYDELKDNGYKTLYSNSYISKEKLFSGDFEIEHIIPQSLLFDDSQSNKTLETSQVNKEKGNQTAIDYIRNKYGEDGIAQYLKRISFLFGSSETRGKYKRLVTKEEDVKDTFDFLNRDLSDSQYIAKKAKEILTQISRVVIPTSGSITARLREDWGLVDAMKELNWDKYNQLGLTETYRNREGHEVRRIKDWTKRNDHRHHAMDALTIAFTRLEHIQYLNNLSSHSDEQMPTSTQFALRNKLISNRKFIPPMPLNAFRAEALEYLSRILVSIKAKNKVATKNTNKIKSKGNSIAQTTLTPRTQLHNETIYGRIKQYVTKDEKVDGSFNEEKIETVSRKEYREALLQRLYSFNGDAKKAFTGPNSLDKSPIWLNATHTSRLPLKVKTVTLETIYTIRKPISKDIKIDKVINERVKRILRKRLEEYNGDATAAFSNLDDNPIWLDKSSGISIKSVTLKDSATASLHTKRDKDGKPILDANGNTIPVDFVSTSNNHHSAIFIDQDGKLHDHVVTYFEAIKRLNDGQPVIDKNYNKELGWEFLFTIKQNEYFVFPNKETGFNPKEIDLINPANKKVVSANIFRAQILTKSDYTFRHHLETNVNNNIVLKNITWKRIRSMNEFNDVVKVRINNIGQVVQIGDY